MSTRYLLSSMSYVANDNSILRRLKESIEITTFKTAVGGVANDNSILRRLKGNPRS